METRPSKRRAGKVRFAGIVKLSDAQFDLFLPAPRELVQAKLDEAVAAYPGLEKELEDFVPVLAEKAAGPSLAKVRAPDLLLAFACGRGNPVALRAFDTSCLSIADQLTPQFRKLRASSDEVKQILREKLLLPGASGRAKILDYRGEGQLTSWVRVTATRLLIQLTESHQKESPLEDELMRALVDPNDDAELTHLKTTYRQELKEAFATAVLGLSFRQRNLLRYSLCDQLSLEAIGGIYAVNKSTISRWLEAARTLLFDEARKAFQERLRVSDSEYDSIVRMVMSHVDLSLARHLAPEEGEKKL